LYSLNSFKLGKLNGELLFNQKFCYLGRLSALLSENETSTFFSLSITYKLLRSWAFRNYRTLNPYASLFGFIWNRFILFSGLGYKRRFSKRFEVMFNYVADRHWILYRFSPHSLIGPNKKRNFVLYSIYKGVFNKDYNFFSSLRRPYVYKMKGFIDTRVRGRFLFVRRIKIRSVRTKLSKKQKLL